MSALVEVDDVVVGFRAGGPPWAPRRVQALRGVSLGVEAGRTLGVVGESGSGKSTLGRCVLGLTVPDAGSVRFEGRDLRSHSRADRTAFRRRVQPVFQDPYGSLDPRWPVGRSVREALDGFGIGTAADREARVRDLLDRVGLDPALAGRLPRELSGGQRQRVGIAAALASGPDLLVADEPVSALDVSVQAQVLNLLTDLQRDLGLACLFIAHDLGVVDHVSDQVAVLYLGRVVETGSAAAVLADPQHPYTRALVAAIPSPDPAERFTHQPLAGEIPSPIDPPSGCAFHPRCPLAVDGCRVELPTLVPLGQDDVRLVACPVVTAPTALDTDRPTTPRRTP